VQDEGFGEKYVIYDSVKGREHEGLTHYSITVAKTGPDQGLAEWRVMRTARAPLSMTALRDYWNPVEDCAARAKP
jgi:hypothetical protein